MAKKTSLKGKGQKTLAALAVACACVGAPVAHAGGAATGGATEVTQILNNLELLFQTMMESEDLALQADHYVTLLEQLQTQVNQYDTMLQNLENTTAGTIAKTIGGAIDLKNQDKGSIGETIAKVRVLGSAAEALKRSSGDLARIMKDVDGAARRTNMSHDDFIREALSASNADREYFQAQANEANRAADQLQVDAQAFQDIAAQIPHARGNLQALGQLTQSSVMAGKVAAETKATLSQMHAMQAHKNVREQDEKEMDARYQEEMRKRLKRGTELKW